ncbi:hypothetical protein GCM10010497_45920 [Streptomyces cinereoruber]|uniref:Antitoxin n=1 Tax=Streptomyces cinereoruber TaxID=67260 RepID=A0AAV4KQM3_9ACTN|nr:hypothetical protein [Streptomyces cinereoruber]MBB4160061.1 hypothetical protein [Streptomyces cinereoruber]MBY8818328.1 hypothetical protein [Streptomyces cinereoruber]NIH60999.1 hypothetical protein [Streptomyces cinereoruber]QEV33286.1 hypothetical protein CP977_14840 [Streptomyces cinereoruber]GGR37858.1 hypothetical protein GCM10010497_45920 [Streptomyces cinereoruber]
MGFFKDKAAEIKRDATSSNPADIERAADTLAYALAEGGGNALQNLDALTRAMQENNKKGRR